mmetsp:Transcript_21875/g.28183  ORF Transcript_21875/g.28183 Transcript_21875/m.28183 type:complete len:673 (-) Transcript_21875:1103-3121(-)
MHAVGTFDRNGNIQNMEELRKARRKKGLCPECGDVKTHKVSFGGLKCVAITDKNVMKGRCLACFPLDSGRGVRAPVPQVSSTSVSVSQPIIAHAHVEPQPGVSVARHLSQDAPSSVHGHAVAAAAAPQVAVPDERLTINRNSYSYKKKQKARLVNYNSNVSSVSIQSTDSEGDVRYSGQSAGRNLAHHTHPSAVDVMRTSMFSPMNGSFQSASIGENECDDPYESLETARRDMLKRGSIQNTSIRNIASLLRSYRHETPLQEESVTALFKFTENQMNLVKDGSLNEDELTTSLAPTIDALVDAMRSNKENEKIQDTACQALWMMTTQKSLHLLISQVGGVSSVVDALIRYPKVRTMQVKGCTILSNLSSDESLWSVLGQLGVISILLNTMKNFVMHEELLLVVCGTLANLTVIDSNRERVVNERGLALITDTMSTHGKVVELQEQLLKVLRNVSSGDENYKYAIHDVEGIDTIVMIMRTHPRQTKIQMLSCWTLSNLAVSKSLKTYIGQNGAMNLIIDSMWEQDHDAKLIEYACRALWSLSVDPDNKAEIGHATGIDSIINGMRQHEASFGVQEKGCGALSNLAANSENNKIIIANSEGIDVIKQAMEIHPSHEGVQDKGCLALRKLVTENTLPLMACLELQDVLEHARRTFPGKCAKRADYILEKLSTAFS